MKQALEITEEIANRYRIEFGKDKSKMLIIGKSRQTKNIEMNMLPSINEMKIETTHHYKYQGLTVNDKFNLEQHIKQAIGKTEAAYQTILTILCNKEFLRLEMKIMWKLVETCIIPTITYAMETMELTKTEKNSLNKLLDNIIKRILKTPQGTPRESLYIESNLLDIETIIEKKRIGMMYRIHQHPNTITEEVTKPTSKLMINTQEITKKYNIDKDYLLNLPKRKAKKLIRKSVHKTFRKKIMANMENKTKIDYLLKHYTPGEKTNYTNNLNRQEVSTLFKTRTRMIDIKGNYKNKYPDQTCRLQK